jgi:hypothetical protein
MKAVRLETFNKERKPLTRASGFLIRETDGLFLYTCWHVVTGIDFLNLNRMTPPISPSFIKLSCTNVET